ncbi:hypothetical protein P168DRAFT_302082 [Aspergillus campestris IBT 28561]|uniref:Aminoglycoside phosphotransferase domain-containing protein n=1 Tax=Aspergillus campestris (strain IBT 28561) TaxID=1392248 RepID=A0A2I1DB35_ASPC2|nr:uncharacterized protein P168DRAFT_302082 [Aspergillus campestris IBT 28561]PKY07084.1 hypothetical protein P168DRAFT_302082 [Aspergillus campestris IBT 28561]
MSYSRATIRPHPVDQREKDYPGSSFFGLPNRHLPTLVEVRARSHDAPRGPQPRFLVFDHLDLFVNFGPCFKVAEAQCLRFIQQTFQGRVPVPEVFGWRVDCGNYVFIYMERIQGQMLLDQYIGSFDQQRLLDYVSHLLPEAGPFDSIAEFNDWFSNIPQARLPLSKIYKDRFIRAVKKVANQSHGLVGLGWTGRSPPRLHL